MSTYNTKSNASAFKFDVEVSEKLDVKLICLTANQKGDVVYYKATVAKDFGYKGLDVSLTEKQYKELSKKDIGTPLEVVATTRTIYSREHDKSYDIPYNSIVIK